LAVWHYFWHFVTSYGSKFFLSLAVVIKYVSWGLDIVTVAESTAPENGLMFANFLHGIKPTAHFLLVMM